MMPGFHRPKEKEGAATTGCLVADWNIATSSPLSENLNISTLADRPFASAPSPEGLVDSNNASPSANLVVIRQEASTRDENDDDDDENEREQENQSGMPRTATLAWNARVNAT